MRTFRYGGGIYLWAILGSALLATLISLALN